MKSAPDGCRIGSRTMSTGLCHANDSGERHYRSGSATILSAVEQLLSDQSNSCGTKEFRCRMTLICIDQ